MSESNNCVTNRLSSLDIKKTNKNMHEGGEMGDGRGQRLYLAASKYKKWEGAKAVLLGHIIGYAAA